MGPANVLWYGVPHPLPLPVWTDELTPVKILPLPILRIRSAITSSVGCCLTGQAHTDCDMHNGLVKQVRTETENNYLYYRVLSHLELRSCFAL